MDFKNVFGYARETDAILIIQGDENSVDKTFFYLTGVDGGLFEGSALIVKPDEVKIITSALEEETARKTGLEVIVANGKTEFEKTIKDNLGGLDSIGLNYSALTVSRYKDVLRIIPDKEFVDVSSSIMEARRMKSPEELSRIREAAKIGSEAFESTVTKLKEGMTESEVSALIAYEMMKLGASEPSFSTIVAFGENASMPHYSPGDRKLKKNDFVLIDFGARYRRYCSDITRTVVFGRASPDQREMYDVVFRAQDESMKTIKENVNGKDVDAVARKIIDSTKFKGRFIHSLGHGLGMDVHDHPALSSNYDFPLKANMVVTVEPGVYVPRVGGVRIEDDVIVKKDGFELITTAPRELMEIS
ncbi:MAG: Xaa-Pro peptidase family protein [Candidatus Thermoplasmatota archaeon]|nr:Xaa-Pro peptidase family protein [Candidatus Thermoplasmatota archaeon]MCL5880994.1 Xaa-Pro peptidase family protein [Candidatus Thermoplasmatota archaeon]